MSLQYDYKYKSTLPPCWTQLMGKYSIKLVFVQFSFCTCSEAFVQTLAAAQMGC